MFRPVDMWDAAANGDLKRLQQHIRARTVVYKPQSGAAGINEVCPVSGWTALHYAAANGRLKASKVLLEHSADAWALTRGSGETPLHLAARSGNLRVMRLLLECCDSVADFVNDREGNSVVHAACISGDLRAVQLFFDRFAPQDLGLLVEPGEFTEEIDEFLERSLRART